MVKIVERIQKCNHPKLNPGNKRKMEVRYKTLGPQVTSLSHLTVNENDLELGVIDAYFVKSSLFVFPLGILRHSCGVYR